MSPRITSVARAQRRAALRGCRQPLADLCVVQVGGVRLNTPPALQVPALDAHVAMISGDVAQVQGLGRIFGILCVQTQPDETGSAPMGPGALFRAPRVLMRGVGLARWQGRSTRDSAVLSRSSRGTCGACGTFGTPGPYSFGASISSAPVTSDYGQPQI